MAQVFDTLSERLALLERYEARYGPLPPADEASALMLPSSPTPVTAPATTATTITTPSTSNVITPPPQTYLNGLDMVLHVPNGSSGVSTPESSPF